MKTVRCCQVGQHMKEKIETSGEEVIDKNIPDLNRYDGKYSGKIKKF